MSYTAVPTVATGDVWTASNHNLYIRDNFRAIVPDVITAKGELILAAGADTLQLLSVGTDGYILHGDLAWHIPTELIQMCDSSAIPKQFHTSTVSGNLHIPTDFDVPAGANWIYCAIELLSVTSTAYFVLYPSYDTTIESMRVDAHGSTIYSQCHGIMPLDSTGGLYYLATDTAEGANLYVFAWMY